MSENILELTDANFQNSITDGIIMVDFWAPWCAPCNMIAPIIEEIVQELKGKIKICKVNIDENQQTAADIGIVSIPTIVIFKDGREEARIVGAVSKDKILEKIEMFVK